MVSLQYVISSHTAGLV